MTRQRLLQCAAFAVVVWVEWMTLSVRSLHPDTFDVHAIELERTRTWRYGYVRQYRGGSLVRARLGADAPPLTPVDATDTIAPAKVHALHRQQRAAAVESVIYGSLWAIWFNGLLRLRRTLAQRNSARRLQRQHVRTPARPQEG